MDILIFGLSVAAIGMLVVFAGLVILIGCVKAISLFGKVGAKKNNPASVKAASAPVAVAVAAPAAAPAASTGIAPEVMAAITAAIAAVWQGEQGFVVRHVKRVNNAPAWNRAGREDQTYSRY